MSPTVNCSCPRYTLAESNLPLLKLVSVVIGIVTLLTFIVLAESAAARVEATEQPVTPVPLVTRLLIVATILIPNVVLCTVLWCTGWGAWVHEQLHGGVMRSLGVRPAYGKFLRTRWIRGDYCVPSQPHLFGRSGFAAITLAPALVLFMLGVALSVASPYSVIISLALAWQVGSCSGDVLFAWHLWRAPRLSLIEDLGNTIVIHRPEPDAQAEAERYRCRHLSA
ncbi:MAG: DUF3267 domain-containing protein [Chloroflexi bacterium]|nr:DUF3267 domain-containing protein [Chloroflexota bacterium]